MPLEESPPDAIERNADERSTVMDPSTRVCLRCGSETGQHEYCGTCGLHLVDQPELPTRAEWEERLAGRPPGSQQIGPHGAQPVRTADGPRGEPRRRGAAGKILLGLLAVAAIAVLTVIIASGGGEEPNRIASNASPPVDPAPSDAEMCVDRWNSGASNNAKQIIGQYARDSRGGDAPTYVSAGFSADVQDRCLITVAQPDVGQGGVSYQFTETAQGTFEFPSSSGESISALPESVKDWTAHGDREGIITLGAG